jgi:tetratricopeptide (TPR) repeat protein
LGESRGNQRKPGDFAGAIADYTQALKLNPQMTDLYHNRGATYLMLDRLKETEADFRHYRELGGTLKPETEQLLHAIQQRHSIKPKQRGLFDFVLALLLEIQVDGFERQSLRIFGRT